MTSSGTAAVTVNSAKVTGSGFAASGVNFPVTLNPGQAATVSVQFDPTVAGSATGQITISSNSTSNPTAVVSLSGTGTTATPSLTSLTCSSASLTGSTSDACTVTLSGSAPSGGVSVSLSSSNGAITVPGSVAVPANASSVGFVANVSSVSSAQSVTLTATANGVSKVFTIQLSTSAATLSINASSVSFGDVVVNSSATQSLTLTSTGATAVTVSSAAVTGSGFSVSGSSFPLTLNPGQSVALSVQFAPASTGSVTGKLTISSNSSTNPTAAISLSGTGATHEVDLSWNAPSGSTVTIAGYHIYRALGGTSSYQILSSSDVQTSYADTTVQGGLAYDYIVKSVDTSGVESAPSNITSVSIP